jgi:hypothetical protein
MHCGCAIIGHGIEARGVLYCCNHCARQGEMSASGGETRSNYSASPAS